MKSWDLLKIPVSLRMAMRKYLSTSDFIHYPKCSGLYQVWPGCRPKVSHERCLQMAWERCYSAYSCVGHSHGRYMILLFFAKDPVQERFWSTPCLMSITNESTGIIGLWWGLWMDVIFEMLQIFWKKMIHCSAVTAHCLCILFPSKTWPWFKKLKTSSPSSCKNLYCNRFQIIVFCPAHASPCKLSRSICAAIRIKSFWFEE